MSAKGWNLQHQQQLPDFTHRRHWDLLYTTVSTLNSATTSTVTPSLYAVVYADDDDDEDKPLLLHPLTLKPHPYNRPINVDLLKSRTTSLVFFDHTSNFSFDKFVIPRPRAATVDGDAMVVLYGGGKLLGRLPSTAKHNLGKWVVLSEDKFDDIMTTVGCTYVVDRLGRLFVINSITHCRDLRLGRAVTARPDLPVTGQDRWRKRLAVDDQGLCLVVRVEEKVFRVYELTQGKPDCWVEVYAFGGTVLFVSKGCCFFMDYIGGKEYKDCIVFSESGFPKYGDEDDCWEYNDEDEIGVFRMSDGRCGRVGDSVDFPDIDWSLPSWVFDVREADKDDRDVQSKAANVEGDTSLQEDVPASLFASVSTVEEEVTRTLHRMSSGNVATDKEFSRKNTTVSVITACTSSSTTKGYNGDSSTAKFEGFDIASDLVPTLQKIWRNHGNVTENSTIRNIGIIARVLESLATVVQTLENNPIQSLSDDQVDYLSTTLSDLKIMSFKVHWLSSFVEKAVKLHKRKALVDSLSKLGQLSTQVKEHKAALLDKVAKLTDEENKLTKEMAKVSKAIPSSEQVKFDEPLGSGLT